MKLNLVNNAYRLLAKQEPATAEHIQRLEAAFPCVPSEYESLVGETTEIELMHENGQYIRIWGPDGCIDMSAGYDISRRIPGSFPIGDNGGGRVIFYMNMNGKDGYGLYHVGYGDLDADDAVFAAPSLTALLHECVGIDTFSL